ncbi:MAG: bifunctional oligoribonuclease/PAP phosphatase NrnA [Saprospiraceae bacterium]|nr:bifunctional oligoribonuclease/PAP phosphatase NrnA [Saprospiraceae bacterium]
MNQITELKLKLDQPKSIVILSHRNPDGDAIGSSLAVYHYFINKGHSVKVIVPSEYPSFLSWMPNVQDIVIYDIDKEMSEYLIVNANVIFCLDFNSIDRIDRMGEFVVSNTSATKILIDHHLYPENFTDYLFSDTSASSTCEMVYDFLRDLDSPFAITPLIGDCLYTGMVTDTGSFKYATSPKLFRTVANLLEIGVDDYRIQQLIFNQLPAKSLRLLGYCLYKRMQILEEFHTGIISLSRKDFEVFNIQRGDTEGIVNYLLTLKEVKLAILVTEQPNNIVKLSLRSKGDLSAQEIARAHFNGGGHKNASGGHSFMHLNNTIAKIKEILPLYKQKIIQSKGY